MAYTFLRFPHRCLWVFLAMVSVSYAADKRPGAKEDTRPAEAVRVAQPERPRQERAASDEKPGELSARTVYQLLIGEFAMLRGDSILAINAYADLALRTKDVNVLQRTAELGMIAKRFDIAEEASRLWVEQAPQTKEAKQSLVRALLLAGRTEELAPELIALLKVDSQALPQNLVRLNMLFSHHTDKQRVYHTIEQVTEPFLAAYPEAYFARVLAALNANLPEKTRETVRLVPTLKPDWTRAVLSNADLLAPQSLDRAIAFLTDFMTYYPKSQEAHAQLARALMQRKRYPEARQHFETLVGEAPENSEFLFSAAMLAYKENDFTAAEQRLEALLKHPLPDKSYVYYYLGALAEKQKNIEKALGHYQSIGEGQYFISAIQRRAVLLLSQKKAPEALALLESTQPSAPEDVIGIEGAKASILEEEGDLRGAFTYLAKLLQAYPENVDLLYRTAVFGGKIGEFDFMEQHLRKLISLRPDHAHAHNALGYSFAERNIRLAEARKLIEKALSLEPEHPAILDSMGWVLFRQGEFTKALQYLEKSYRRQADPEVAAHIGEVLWVMKRHDEAKTVWNAAKVDHPNHQALEKVMQKYVPTAKP